MTVIDSARDPTDPGPDESGSGVPNQPDNNGQRPRRAPTQVAPHDLDAEAALLSAALTDPNAIIPILDGLPTDALYHPAHTEIAIAVLSLAEDGLTPDPVTVAARLRQTGQYDHAGPTLLDVTARAAPPTAATGYAQIILDHQRRRTALALAAEVETAARAGQHHQIAQLLETALAQIADPTDQPCASALIDWPTLWEKDRHDADWLAEPILARGRGHAIYATAKAGKSLLVLEVAAALATGRPILDQAAGPTIPVTYFDLEMTEDDLTDRLADLGYGSHDDLSMLSYYLLPNLPALDTPDGGRTVERIVARHQSQLVLFDTTSRVVAGAENDADTFRAFYRHTGSRLKAAGVTYARLDHTGKDATLGQRGSSAKADDVDVVWSMTATDSGVKLKATHSRMNWVEQTVDLLRLTDPLVHKRIAASWPAGTQDKADQLDRLGVPLDANRRAARELIKAAGETPGKNDILGAGLKWRRTRPAGGPG